MAEVGRLFAILGLDPKQFEAGIRRQQRLIKRFGKDVEVVGRSLSRNLSLPLVALATGAVKATADFETAMAGVAKTVDASASEIETLGIRFQTLSESIPVSANELARLGEVAGQLGVQFDAIPGFVQTVAKLGVATNLSAEEAATSLARLSNIMGTSQEDFERLGSTIVDLGNNLATTESEITEMALRIAGAGKTVGLTEAQVLSFSAALSSVGVRAEAGGSAFSKLVFQIAGAVSKGSAELRTFAAVAGQTVAEFSTGFRDDAGGAIASFLLGLGQIQASGGDTLAVLENLAITEVRLRDAILRVAGATGTLENALRIGNRAWQENTALAKEADRFFKRLAAAFIIIRNRIVNIAVELGDTLRPAIEVALDSLGKLLTRLRQLTRDLKASSREAKLWAAGILAMAAAIGPLLVGLGLMARGVAVVSKAFVLMARAVRAIAVAMLFLALNPVTLVVTALVGLVAALKVGSLAASESGQSFRDFVAEIPLVGDAISSLVSKAKILFLEFQLAITSALQRVAVAIFDFFQSTRDLPIFGDLGEKAAFALAPFITSMRDARRELDSPLADEREFGRNVSNDLERQALRNKLRSEGLNALGFTAEGLPFIDPQDLGGSLREQIASAQEGLGLDLPLNVDLDASGLRIDQVVADVESKLRAAEAGAGVLGTGFDLLSEKASVLEGAIRSLLEEGVAPTAPAIRRMGAELAAVQQSILKGEAFTEFGEILGDLNSRIAEVDLSPAARELRQVTLSATELGHRAGLTGEAYEAFVALLVRQGQQVNAAMGGLKIEDVLDGVRKSIDEVGKTANELDLSRGIEMIRSLGEAWGIAIADVDAAVVEYQSLMHELTERTAAAAERIKLDLSGAISGSISEITTGFLRGTRENLDVLETFKDAAIGIFGSMLSQMLKEKLEQFDPKFKSNFLKDLLGAVKTFAFGAAEEIGGLAEAIPSVPAGAAPAALPSAPQGDAGSDVQAGALQRIQQGALALWNAISQGLEGVLGRALAWAGDLVSAVAGGLGGLGKAVGGAFSTVLQAAQGFGSQLVGGFRSLFGGVLQGLGGLLSGALNLISSAIQGLSGSGGTGGLVTGIIGIGISLVGLAEGGIVTGPTLALVGEGGESEAVIPLSRLKEFQGKGGGDVTVIVNSPLPTRTEERHDAVLGHIIEITVQESQRRLLDDLARGGQVSDGMRRNMGVRRVGSLR